MFFQEVLEGPPDAVFGLAGTFQADKRPNKVSLMVGIYRDEQLKAEMMPAVRKAKEEIFSQDLMADYLPIDGLPDLHEGLGALLFGEDVWKEERSRIYSAEVVGGTAGLRVGAEFLAQEVTKQVFISQPTWPNHRSIFERAGCKVEAYPYYSKEIHGFDFKAFCAWLERAPEKAVVLLHACCHNPTGSDPRMDEWKEISRLMQKRKLLPFFDFAYQGLGEGIEKDRGAINLFLKEGQEMVISYSCSKNFSLYCQRVGALFIVNENSAVKQRVGSQVKRIIRALYSNPPAHGARIVSHVLKEPGLRAEWIKELGAMQHRLSTMRNQLIDRLNAGSKGIDFSFLKRHKGMFSFLDLDKAQVQRLMDEFGVYLLDQGRISVAGLSDKNLEPVVKAILSVCEG